MINFLGPIANLAGTFLEGQLEKSKAKTAVKIAHGKAGWIASRYAIGSIVSS